MYVPMRPRFYFDARCMNSRCSMMRGRTRCFGGRLPRTPRCPTISFALRYVLWCRSRSVAKGASAESVHILAPASAFVFFCLFSFSLFLSLSNSFQTLPRVPPFSSRLLIYAPVCLAALISFLASQRLHTDRSPWGSLSTHLPAPPTHSLRYG